MSFNFLAACQRSAQSPKLRWGLRFCGRSRSLPRGPETFAEGSGGRRAPGLRAWLLCGWVGPAGQSGKLCWPGPGQEQPHSSGPAGLWLSGQSCAQGQSAPRALAGGGGCGLNFCLTQSAEPRPPAGAQRSLGGGWSLTGSFTGQPHQGAATTSIPTEKGQPGRPCNSHGPSETQDEERLGPGSGRQPLPQLLCNPSWGGGQCLPLPRGAALLRRR